MKVKIVAVTSCPTGIAHTYMAAEKLESTARKKGIKIKVETLEENQSNNALSKKDIEEATAVIIAADNALDLNRFKGKPLKEVTTRDAISNAETLINEAANNEFSIHE